MYRLTASKEAGQTIEIGGKKVLLGVPGPQRSTDTKPEPQTYPWIPVARGGTPDDAAASILLYVSFSRVTVKAIYFPSI
jgi:3-oxoacyl-[acyl-carrier protein] reductase